MEYEDEMGPESLDPTPDTPQEPQGSEGERQLVSKILKRIKGDKTHFSDVFKTMREDMTLARRGALPDWPKEHYTANITGRHINQKVASLYAKDPRAIARRRERLDFALWDESDTSFQQAMMIVQQGMEMGTDPYGEPLMAEDPTFQQAMALMQDVQEGMQQRQNTERTGKTLEILFQYFTTEQTPVDFKTSMKQMVRRACTTGVGYLKLGFQREHEQDVAVAERLADFRKQMAHLERLAKEVEDSDSATQEVDEAELQAQISSLEQQEFVLSREGLVFDFPDSSRVIPDRMTKSLTGFVGARWITLEYLYTPDEVEEIFGVDLGKEFKEHSLDGTSRDSDEYSQGDSFDSDEEKHNMACVWEHFDRQSGVVYYVCEGHKSFLRPPTAPDIYTEDFWPVYALTFNEVEDEESLFPPSDVRLIKDMQAEYNRSRQGQREHRQAARPRFVTPTGMIDDESKLALAAATPFSVTEMNIAPDSDIRQALMAVPVPGVDPNLYETSQTMADVQLVAGVAESSFGATAKATATESSIAEGSRIASVDSNVDDLDMFLTRVARASGQVLMREMSEDQVLEIAGKGAVWPQMSLDEIAKEMYLEIEAGSSGRPNQAQEIRNWREMLPFLVQMPNISPTWLVKETLTRLDDKMDLTQAIMEGQQSMMAANGIAQQAPTDDPANAPNAQGPQGANNAPAAPGGVEGTDAALGNNQQAIM